MGFRARIRAKIKGAIGNVDALAKIIHDEANHPGRPQPHMAAKHPLWGGGDPSGQNEAANEKLESPSVEKRAQAKKVDEADNAKIAEQPEQVEADFWFLKQDAEEGDDWSKVNPKKTSKKP